MKLIQNTTFTLCLILIGVGAASAAFVANGPSYQGKEVQIDLPTDFHLKNVGGSDGLGLCVFASMSNSGKWHNEPIAEAIFQWMRRYPGGGWPKKVDDMIKRLAAEKDLPVPEYIQHTSGDAAFLDLALKTGRYPCVTYAGQDGTYYGAVIGHMVNLAFMDNERAAIQDNNYPGKWLWMTRQEFLCRWRGVNPDGSPMMARDERGRPTPIGGGWSIVFLKPGPPPIPVNP
jgi:hypothetical protein